MVMVGKDTSGNTLQRYNTAVTTTSHNKLQLELAMPGSPTVPAGESVEIALRISNIGSTATYTVSVSDSEGYFQAVQPSRFAFQMSRPDDTWGLTGREIMSVLLTTRIV